MAVEISKLAVVLTSNAGPFATGMSGAIAPLDGFVSSVGGAGAAAAGFFGILAAGAATIGLVAAATKGIKLAADYEQAEAAFEVLLGSAGKAKEVLGDLNKFAAETPFELPDLVTGGQNLLAFGVSADQLIPTLRVLGDLSAGNAEKFSQLATIYGKGLTGKITSIDLVQIAEKGIPIFDVLAQQIGKTKAEISAMASEGQIGMGHIQTAFQTLTGKGGKFHGMMDKQSKTLSGLWSTLTDGVNGALRNVAQALIADLGIKDWVTNATARIAELTPAIIGGVKYAFDLVKPAIVALQPVAEGLWEVLKGTGAQMVAVIVPAIKVLVPILEVAAKVLGGILTVIGKIQQGIGGFVAWITGTSKGLQAINGEAIKSAAQAKAAAANMVGNRLGIGDVVKGGAVARKAEEAFKPQEVMTEAQVKAAAATKKATEDTEKYTDKLRDQVRTFGMTSRAAELYKLRMDGATDVQLASAEAIAKQIDQMEAQKKAMEELAAAAKRIAEDIATPYEKLHEQLEQINAAEKAGLLTTAQADAASQKAAAGTFKDRSKDAFKPANLGGQSLDVIERRFTKGFSQTNVSWQEKMLAEAQKQAKHEAEMKKYLKKMAERPELVVSVGA